MIKFFNFFVKLTGWLVQFFCFRTKVYYEDKKVQSRKIKGKAIVISNHFSVYDFAVMMFVFWRRVLRCQVAEITYDKNRGMRFLMKVLGAIRVERNGRDFSFVGKSCEILEKKGVVEIYPEARIPLKGEERPLEFKPSAAHIALLSGAPVIPVYTNGSYFKRKRARVIIGTPIDVGALVRDDLDEKENLENISKILREKVIALQHELERQTRKEKKGTK